MESVDELMKKVEKRSQSANLIKKLRKWSRLAD